MPRLGEIDSSPQLLQQLIQVRWYRAFSRFITRLPASPQLHVGGTVLVTIENKDKSVQDAPRNRSAEEVDLKPKQTSILIPLAFLGHHVRAASDWEYSP